VLKHLHPAHVEVEICRAEELEQRRGLTSELDEMWSDVGKKAEPRWLWHAIDHHSGTVLAYVFGRRKDVVFLQLQALLEPFGITRFYTDGWGAYERHIDPEQHHVGKEHTQKIKSKHINLRTRIKRLVRRTFAFPKRRRCTIWSLVSSSIAPSLGSQSNMRSTPLRHLRLRKLTRPRSARMVANKVSRNLAWGLPTAGICCRISLTIVIGLPQLKVALRPYIQPVMAFFVNPFAQKMPEVLSLISLW